MPNLTDQLRHAFSDRKARVKQALEQSRQERARFSNAEESRKRHQQDIDEATQEMGRLTQQVATALLEGGDDDLEALRERAKELNELIEDRKKRLREVASLLEGGGVRESERLSIGRAQRIAHEEVEAAKKERRELVETLDEAFQELNAEAREATNLQQIYTKEAS